MLHPASQRETSQLCNPALLHHDYRLARLVRLVLWRLHSRAKFSCGQQFSTGQYSGGVTWWSAAALDKVRLGVAGLLRTIVLACTVHYHILVSHYRNCVDCVISRDCGLCSRILESGQQRLE